MTTDTGAIHGEIPSGGAQLVTAGEILMQVTHREMRAVSVQVPRPMDRVLSEVIAEVDRVPAWAIKGFYRRPVGDGVTASGPSVYLARVVARNFGNCSVRSYLAGVQQDLYTVGGVFVDLEKNYITERMQPVSVFAWRKGRDNERGGYATLTGEKLSNALLIGASKAERNAIAAGVPDWILNSAYNRCMQLAADDTKKQLSSVIEFFQIQGVSRERLESHFAGVSLEALDDESLADLRGLANALRDREVRPEEIGGRGEAEPTPAAPDTSGVSDILKSGATITEGAGAEVSPDPNANVGRGMKRTNPREPTPEPSASPEQLALSGDAAPVELNAEQLRQARKQLGIPEPEPATPNGATVVPLRRPVAAESTDGPPKKQPENF